MIESSRVAIVKDKKKELINVPFRPSVCVCTYLLSTITDAGRIIQSKKFPNQKYFFHENILAGFLVIYIHI